MAFLIFKSPTVINKLSDEDLSSRYFNKYDVDPDAVKKLNRKVKLIKATNKYPDEAYSQVMDEMYLDPAASYNGLKTMDASKLIYHYTWMDIHAAAKAKKGTPRKNFIIPENEEIYPYFGRPRKVPCVLR